MEIFHCRPAEDVGVSVGKTWVSIRHMYNGRVTASNKYYCPIINYYTLHREIRAVYDDKTATDVIKYIQTKLHLI